MINEKDYEAVHYMISAMYNTLLELKNERPDLFYSKEFSKWSIMSAINLVCQLSYVAQLDVDTLQLNIKQIWDGMLSSVPPDDTILN